MKKTFILSLVLFVAGSLMASPVTVLSNKTVAKGYYPRLNKMATELTYLSSEQERYAVEATADTYVTNEDLKLVLYRNGVRTELYPHGRDVNYIWSSISPDGTKILFNTKLGTAVCDLQGKELVNLGNYNSPVWYGNDYVVAALEENDGHNFTGGAVVILSLDKQLQQVLTNKVEIGMDPSTSYETGQIAYHDFEGNIHLMQINLAEKAIGRCAIPAIRKVEGVQPKTMRRLPSATKADFSNVKIYINPGHGGFDSDDRGMSNSLNETKKGYIFWESQSNLDKGLHLEKLLKGLKFQTMMSRTQNRTVDDRNLNAIAEEASKWGADFMLSIHSNAGSPSNYVLQLFAGRTPGDLRNYPSQPDAETNKKSFDITTLMGNLMMGNEIATWSRTAPVIAGDKTFAKDVMGWSNGYGVLRKLTVPGTISEGAMHDYFPETYRLTNMDYKHQEAWYFMKTFCHYYGNYQQTKGVIGGQVRDAYRKQTFPVIQRIRNSRDEQLPLNNTTVELLQNGTVIKTYVTDTLYNGVFFFWDLEPGEYTVRVPEGKYDLHAAKIDEQESHFYKNELTVTVEADEITHVDMMMDAQRSTPPSVISYEPQVADITDSVNVSTDIVLNFNWDMKVDETAAAFSISPQVDGTITWENSYRTLRFTPKTKFEKDTEYTVTLGTTACHPDANWTNNLQQEFTLKFRTKNRDNVALLESYPSVGMQDVPLNPMFITIFDEQVDDFMSSYKVVNAAGEEQSIRKRSFDYNSDLLAPNGSVQFELTDALLPNSDYRLIIGPGLTDIQGVKFNKTVEIPFRTMGEEEPEGVVCNSMEEKAFAYDKEASQYMVTASVLKYTDKKMFNTASNQLGYTFADPESFVMYTYLNLDGIIEANGKCKFGMYISGDFSGNELLAVWDAQGDIKYTSFGSLDFAGWKYVPADMTQLPEDVTYQFKGLQIKRGNALLSADGAIYVDNMTLQYVPTALDNIEIDNNSVTKLLENDQIIIIRDGVRYNVLGTVME